MKRYHKIEGFTLVEVIIVVVILSIAALMAVPFAVSGASSQVKSAANLIASDLEYTKSLAITHGKVYSVVFDTLTESYQVQDANGSVINHPISTGSNYIVNFSADSRLDRVNISSVNFNGSGNGTVKFDYLGCPYDGSDSPLNTGLVTVGSGSMTMTINVEPVTGYISITD